MKIDLPPWQRAFQRLLMSWPATAFVRRILHHVDAILLHISDGRLDVTRLSGLPVVEITTVGAKSGVPRSLPLAGFPDGKNIILIASNFGGATHPGWYFNLKANPECVLSKGGQRGNFIAREAQAQERDRYWDLANSYYVGYAAYQQRAGKRKIPVMVLEPKR